MRKMTLSEAREKEKVKIILINGMEFIGKICEYFYAEDEETDDKYDCFVFREEPGKEGIIYENEIKSIEEIEEQ